MGVYFMCGCCLLGLKEGNGFLVNGVIDGCEVECGCRELKLRFLLKYKCLLFLRYFFSL